MPIARPLDERERARAHAQMDKILKRLINGVVEQVEVEEKLYQRADMTWIVVTRRLDTQAVVDKRDATPEDRTVEIG